MVPKLHAKGSSFRGAAAYLLHDKGRADTSHRLDWTEIRNLATDDPHTAWRVMAATAMDQARLKGAAGVKNSGRKSKDAVLHLTLSWHPDESAGLSREEMMRAAQGAIRALKADRHQALIVSHNDEPQKHVHILVNRVNPDDGRLLSSSKEKLALSRWAERYEKERGQVYCRERVLNNAARDRGEYVRGRPDEARHLYERKPAANDNRRAAVDADQKRKDAAAAKKARETRRGQAKELRGAEERHRHRLAAIRAKARRDVAVARQAVRERFRDEWRANFQAEQAEQSVFDHRERTLVGRVQNALKAIDFGSIVRGTDRRRAISEVFQAFAQAGARLEGLRRGQQARARQVAGRQRREEHAAAVQVRSEQRATLAAARREFLEERQTAAGRHREQDKDVRATWRARRQERDASRSEAKGQGDATSLPPAGRERTPAELAALKNLQLLREFKERARGRDVGKDRDAGRDID